jgi:lipoprotein-anchoring transpeptidase ErfK/SrfK
MLRRRLDPERHGSGGYTSAIRLASMAVVVGFFVMGSHMATKAWFDGRILPGVVVGGHNLGGLTLAQARAEVERNVHAYQLSLEVGKQEYKAGAAEIGIKYDIEATVDSAYASGRSSWLPPLHHEPLPYSYRLDRSLLNEFANGVAQKVGTPPVDASLALAGTSFSTVPEKSGWSIDRVGLERLVEDDVSSPRGGKLQLRPHEQTADIQAKNLTPTVTAAKKLMATPISLSYADRTFAPSPADIGSWLVFQKQPDGLAFKLVPQIDIAKLKNYVQSVANDIDVPPINKKVTIENGVAKTTQDGTDGMAIDQDAVTAAIDGAVAKQAPLAYAIATHDVPFKTVSESLITLDLGRYIEVNLSKQHLWVWQDHNVIYDSPVTSGATGAGLATVTGLFSIYYKTTNTHLVGYQYGWNYDVPVKYWMPFYQGFGLHDAVWRNGNFGGPDYYYGGSHGCVNLPDATAEFIYNWSTIGTPVWVHN